MNFASLCAQTTEDPREVYVSATSTAMRCNVLLPPVGNKAPTPIELNVYGKAAERFSRITKNSLVYIHGSKLRFEWTQTIFYFMTKNPLLQGKKGFK